MSRKIVDMHRETFGSRWGYILNKTNTLCTYLGHFRGQNGGQKVIIMFSFYSRFIIIEIQLSLNAFLQFPAHIIHFL